MLTHLVMRVHLLLKVFRLSSNGEGEPNFFSEERVLRTDFTAGSRSVSPEISNEN
jgi:hypothetical protein